MKKTKKAPVTTGAYGQKSAPVPGPKPKEKSGTKPSKNKSGC